MSSPGVCAKDKGAQSAGIGSKKYASTAPEGSLHRTAVPFRKRLFFHTSMPPTNCQVVEMLPTLLEGAKGAEALPGEVE